MCLSHHSCGKGGPPYTGCLYIRCSRGYCLEKVVFKANPASNGATGNELPFFIQPLQEPIKKAFQIYRKYTPFIHHPPSAHCRPTTNSVHGQQVYFGF